MATWTDPPEGMTYGQALALQRAYLGHGDQLGALEAEAYAHDRAACWCGGRAAGEWHDPQCPCACHGGAVRRAWLIITAGTLLGAAGGLAVCALLSWLLSP
jgi:hypothetical protein